MMNASRTLHPRGVLFFWLIIFDSQREFLSCEVRSFEGCSTLGLSIYQHMN